MFQADRSRPIVFRGPSISLEAARRTLPDAEYRPPIKRGDLAQIAAGAVVGIIDGVFDQTLAISPGEVRSALERGVAVYGAASMGALRAVEVRGVIGIGRVYQMYKTGTIERDDEVAVLCDAESQRALSVPLVNIRYAVERVVRSGTIERELADRILKLASNLHYTERTYQNILRQAAVEADVSARELVRLLLNFDLKRDDAQLLLETLAALERGVATSSSVQGLLATQVNECRVQEREEAVAPLLIWEYGDVLEFTALVRFLKLTGKYEAIVERSLGRFALAGRPLQGDEGALDTSGDDAQALLDYTRFMWGWQTPEEAHVTMRDLGIGLDDLAETLEAEAIVQRLVAAHSQGRDEQLWKAMRSDLWLRDLSLKREALRCGALRYFAARASEQEPPTQRELGEARRCIARVRRHLQWGSTRASLTALGLANAEINQAVCELALARRAAQPLFERLVRARSPEPPPTPRARQWRERGVELVSSMKAPGSSRFSLPLDAAWERAQVISQQVGLVRIGLVGELDNVGIHVAQAFGERAGWSSSFSSGKAETAEGAKTGSIMEELEIFAQDRYQGGERRRRAYAGPASHPELVDPQQLDLPYDSRYHDQLELEWSECIDLIAARPVYVPTAALLKERAINDVYYCTRLGTKLFSSSGLGSGFSLAEAAVHAAAEFIERHALRLAELAIENPGQLYERSLRFIDPDTLPAVPRRIVEKFHAAGYVVRIIEMTSEVFVPTFMVKTYRDYFEEQSLRSMCSDGFACHPDPEVAVTSALLESAQTRAGAIAGGREDFSLKARSLGRHERPRATTDAAQVFYFGNDRPLSHFGEVQGFVTRDILEELEWIVDRVHDAGYARLLLVNYTSRQTLPGYVVRVIIPGMETTNSFYTGPRARALSLADLMVGGGAGGTRGASAI